MTFLGENGMYMYVSLFSIPQMVEVIKKSIIMENINLEKYLHVTHP